MNILTDAIVAVRELQEAREGGQALASVYSRHERTINRLVGLLQTTARPLPKCFVYIGGPRTGKSKRAYELYPGAFWKPPGKWWDGYENQEIVVFDDFDGSQYEGRALLQLINPYPFTVEVKGGTRQLRAHTFVFTTNSHPTTWYCNSNSSVTDPLMARFAENGSKMFDVTGVGEDGIREMTTV